MSNRDQSCRHTDRQVDWQ